MTPSRLTAQEARTPEPRIINGRPEGQIDYELDCNIREAVALYGYEHARDLVAQSLNRLNDRINRL
jgi:hypothetical protein